MTPHLKKKGTELRRATLTRRKRRGPMCRSSARRSSDAGDPPRLVPLKGGLRTPEICCTGPQGNPRIGRRDDLEPFPIGWTRVSLRSRPDAEEPPCVRWSQGHLPSTPITTRSLSRLAPTSPTPFEVPPSRNPASCSWPASLSRSSWRGWDSLNLARGESSTRAEESGHGDRCQRGHPCRWKALARCHPAGL